VSLLRRIERGGKTQRILHSLLGKLYPEEGQLTQVTETIIGETTLLAEGDQESLNSDPINFVIGFHPKESTPPIRVLLEELDAEGQLFPHFETIVAEESIELTDSEQVLIQTNLVDFLMGFSKPRPTRRPASLMNSDEPTRKMRDKILGYIQDDDEIQQLGMRQHPDLSEVRRVMQDLFDTYLEQHQITLAYSERQELFATVVNEYIGLSILEPLLADETISEIHVLGPKNITIVHNGMLKQTSLQFDSFDHILRVIDRMIAPLGKRFDETMPIMNFRLSDGWNISVTHFVIANNGPIVNIFRRNRKLLNRQDLIQFGTLSLDIMTVLEACVDAQCNILVTGLPHAGKTTLLNVLGNFMPPDEFIVTIEVSEELQLTHEAVAILHTRPANIENKGAVTLQHLLQHVQSMRPERILVGEVTGEEVSDLLTMVVPWMTTFRAHNPEDAVAKLESLYLLAGKKGAIKGVRSRIADSVDLIIHLDRLRSGKRIVTRICEVHYNKDDQLIFHDLFRYIETQREGLWTAGMLRLENLPSDKLRQQLRGSHKGNDILTKLEAMLSDNQ